MKDRLAIIRVEAHGDQINDPVREREAAIVAALVQIGVQTLTSWGTSFLWCKIVVIFESVENKQSSLSSLREIAQSESGTLAKDVAKMYGHLPKKIQKQVEELAKKNLS